MAKEKLLLACIADDNACCEFTHPAAVFHSNDFQSKGCRGRRAWSRDTSSSSGACGRAAQVYILFIADTAGVYILFKSRATGVYILFNKILLIHTTKNSHPCEPSVCIFTNVHSNVIQLVHTLMGCIGIQLHCKICCSAEQPETCIGLCFAL